MGTKKNFFCICSNLRLLRNLFKAFKAFKLFNRVLFAYLYLKSILCLTQDWIPPNTITSDSGVLHAALAKTYFKAKVAYPTKHSFLHN